MRTFLAAGGSPGPPAFLATLLGVALLGCGAGQSATSTRQTTQASSDPTVLAAAIDRAQESIDDASTSPADLRKAALGEQLVFRQLTDHRQLRRPTLAQLSPSGRSATTAALRASDALARIVPNARRFPRWRIIAPPPPARLLRYFRAADASYRIPWQYLAAVELVETRMGRIRGLSSAGAKGPMQFLPSTWAEYGRGNINSQHDSIVAAARFLAANRGTRHIGNALFHYNPSRSYVTAVESYAHEMRRDRRAFYGYYNWQVFYRTTRGTFLLPVGYPRARPRRLPGS